MNLPKYIILSAAILLPSITSAITLNLSSGPTDKYFADASNAALIDGNLIRVGVFPSDTPNVDFSNFIEWDTSVTASVPFFAPQAGRFSETIVNGTSESTYEGRRIYVWVYNAPTSGSATQYGIFSALSDPDWVFSTTAPTTIGIADISAGLNSGTVIGATTVQLAAIPEPATYAGILGLGAVLITFLRNRRAKR